MLLGQLDILSQPRAEPGLLLLFEVVCMCGGVGDVLLPLQATCSSSRLSLLFPISPLAGAGRAWASNPLPRSSGMSPTFPFPEAVDVLGGLPPSLTIPFFFSQELLGWGSAGPSGILGEKYGAPQRIQEIGCVWQSKELCNSGVCQPVLADLWILQ